ncbi:MAG: M1 family aminopeptidase [Candidatus Krumholzibacteriia bacterium]
MPTMRLWGRPARSSRRHAPLTLAAVFVLAPGAATLVRAEGGYRLGQEVVPTFQAITLRINAGEKDYDGSTHIELQVKETTRSFSFHAEEMPIHEVILTGKDGPVELEYGIGDHAMVEVTTSKPLVPGRYALDIDFANGFGTKAVGLYRMEQDGRGYVFTQFEADEAREAFPCWDEPSFKIEWQLTIEVPEDHVAITNTLVETESVEGGWRRTAFKRTKPLPSYLIAIAAGPLEVVPIPGMPIPGNVVTLQGQSHLAQLAAETTPPILAALEKYFGSRYPYEKLDLIGIPEYWAGAMEHPGAVTYAASILLVDPEAASVRQQRTLARVTAHELAHMWFGNLVTMRWWDDLWLNESFADWMGDKIAHEVYPQYNLEVAELQGVMGVMVGDARPSAQAIRRPVETADNLLENIGTQYNKGKAILSMFEQWIGEEQFRLGVLEHLNAHKWGNATGDDFWQALSGASGNDVPAAMATFIEQPGIALVSVEIGPGNTIRLSQKRFANYGIEQEEQTWKIPVTLRYSDGNVTHTKTVLLEQRSQEVTLDLGGKPAWVVPNADQRGYYRWSVSPEMLAALARNSLAILNERERVGFIGNLSALLDAGAVSGDDYLLALGEFANDPKPMVVSALLGALGKIEMAFVPAELEDSFAYYVRRTLTPALERFGIEAQEGEDEEVAIFRPRLLRWLADTGKHEKILEHAEELASRYAADPSSIDPALAGVALRLAAIRGDRALYEEYRQRFESAQVPADRNRYLGALGNFRDPQIMDTALGYALEGPLRPNELFRIPGGMMSNPRSRDFVFHWILEKYDDIAERVPPMFMGFMPFIAGGCSAERLAAAQEFFALPGHQAPGTETNLAKITDQVQDCVGLREREGAAVAAYLNRLLGSR